MPVAIRAVRPDEAEAVALLLVRANEEHLARFPPPVAAGYRPQLLDVAGRLSSAEVYVAVDGDGDGGIVGTVTFVPDADDDDHPWPPGGSVLRFLAVAPEARRRGVGRQLTEWCIGRARRVGAAYLALHTAPVMTAASRLYEALGFERAPDRDFDPMAHYGDGHAPDEPPWGLAYILRLS